jgi:hypothetical protein
MPFPAHQAGSTERRAGENTPKNEAGAAGGCTKAHWGHLQTQSQSNRGTSKLKTARATDSRNPRFYTRLFWG